MEEEEDADLQEAIRRSMDDYHAMHAVTAATAYTSWSQGTPVRATSPSRQLRQHPAQRGFPVPLHQQQPQYRHQTHMPRHQQQLRSPSSSSHQGAGGVTLRGPVGLWEGAYSSSLPAAAVTSSPPPLRSSSPSAAAVSPASPFSYRAVAAASPASPFPLRSSAAAGSGRAAAAPSATVSALRENRGGTTAAAAGAGALPAAGRLATGVDAAGAGEARPYSLSSGERPPASLNWLCHPDELFPSWQLQQQQHCLRQPPRQSQQRYSPQVSPVSSLPLSSSLALRQQQTQPPAQLRQLQVSEPYLQLARQQQQLEEQLQQQGGGQEGRSACLVTGASEEENVALQQAIQESLLTCPSLPSPRRSVASPAAAAAGRAADGGSMRKEEAADVTQEEAEQLPQQYELHSPSSSRLLLLPTTAAASAARGYLEDISELLLPPLQQPRAEDERRPQQQKSLAQQQRLLQHHAHPTQQQQQEKEEAETTTGAAAAAAGEVLKGRKAPTDRCKAPLSWIREEEAEETAEETLAPFTSLSASADDDAGGGSCVSAHQPDAAAGSEGLAAKKTATHEEVAAPAQQQQSSTDASSKQGDNSRTRGTRKNEEEMRKLLLQQMQPLPAAPDLKELFDVVFGEEGVNREIDPGDFSRWFHHPFLFAGDVSSRLPLKRRAKTAERPAGSPPEEEEEDAECRWLVNSSTQWKENASWCSWGLVQLHGGPCGLLAAVQCFLLRALLFSPGRVKRYTHLLMLHGRQRHKQQQIQQLYTQQQQQPQRQRHTQQEQQTEQQQVETAAGEELEEERDGVWPRGERQGAVASSLSSSKHIQHSSSGDQSANKCTGQRRGEWNVELLSLLPSPLTRRHALVEAVAAVLYQSTPVSLYTVAYVLPADVEELQQPAAAAAEEAGALLHADDGPSSRERRRSSSSSVRATAADEGEAKTAATAARDVGVKADEPGSSSEPERAQGTQKNARKKTEVKGDVSEMLEDVRVYIRRFRRIEDVMHFYNLFYDVLLARETGVISFLFSVLLTRGIQQVVNDMDMPGHSLIGVYGHCSQDLVNLLLLGAASSNVFDGDRKLGSSTTSAASTQAKEKAEGGAAGKERRREGRAAEGGAAGAAEVPIEEKREKISNTDEEKEENPEEEQTHLKGVRKRPLAGFLSEMEALRYCEVGSRYKHPHFPLWVVGSSNHYATLFSRDLLAAAVPSARLAEMEAQAAFRDFDRDGNFLILTEHLAALLTQLGQQERLIEAQRATCAAEGVVLLSDFLKWYSKVVMQQRSQSGEDVEPPKKFTLYIYDGQTPPGPSLRRFLVEASSSHSSSSSNEEVEAGEMKRLLSTRWPAAAVSELPLLPLHLSTNA